VQLKYFTNTPAVFPRFIRGASPDARPGDLVHVFDKEGRPFGGGFFNPRARIPLRMLHHGPDPVGEEDIEQALDRAVALRRGPLRLDESGDAWRAVHGDGDGLGGLVVDKFADVLSVEVTNLGVWRRIGRWLPRLHAALGTRRAVVQVDPDVARYEGIDPRSMPELEPVKNVRITEHGLRFGVDFAEGHKTGFFCDQRDNRRQFAHWTGGRRVLDLCCYTGGFSIAAKVGGGAAEVTGVDLDEKAIGQARANANLNQARIRWVHADAFDYARQMLANRESFGAVVLDPPKFVNSRDDQDLARRKYNDLNALGVSLVERGGLFVTCSCSGLLSVEDFEQLVIGAAHRHGRRLQILDRTGAGPDHPVMSHCPEGRYLKVLWAIVR
jgi:23S rRNA (cytosine1962-C5)-methyltransferase